MKENSVSGKPKVQKRRKDHGKSSITKMKEKLIKERVQLQKRTKTL